MTDLASIDQEGMLTAHSVGVIKVVATANDGSEVSSELIITIMPQPNDVPGEIVLSDNNGHDTGILNGDYLVNMNVWWGNNGREYKLYENDMLIDAQILTEDSPNAQSTVTSITYKKNGSYRYYAELTNEFGTTRSNVLTVTVTQAEPAKPALSHNNWSQMGNYKVSMNMWWGTNASLYRIYENGILIDTQVLTEHSSQAQTAVTEIQNKAKGSYEYQAELINYAGSTFSEKIIVEVK